VHRAAARLQLQAAELQHDHWLQHHKEPDDNEGESSGPRG
jgi:hypothetical protein